MTPKRIVLSVLTLLVVWVMGNSLYKSLGEPQVGNQLQLYQTDLLVQASEWNGSGLPDNEVAQFKKAVFGEDALDAAIEQYQEVRKDAATGLARLQQQIQDAPASSDEPNLSIMAIARSQQRLIEQIDLRLGMVQSQQSLTESPSPNAAIAATLIDLWKAPPIIRPDARQLIENQLRGWYRYTALNRLYTLENKTELLAQLKREESAIAEKTVIQLSVVSILP